jgi:signal peptidase I
MVISEEKKDETADPSRYDAKRPRIIDYAYDVVEMIVLTLMAAIVITSIFFRFSFVDGHSMDRTLSDGDTLIISNLFYTPEYGDIVVIEYENNIHKVTPLIKRVIGLPGDTIRVTEDGDVYRNGERLNEEEYVYLDAPLFATLKGEWKVGEDEVFVMGDHRNDSIDSREIGPIKLEKIIGQAIFRLFPIKDIGTID